jgi:hypothetical protein
MVAQGRVPVARLALRETAEVAGGASITLRTIDALWPKGGNAALEAVRIAWDSRNADGVRAPYAESFRHGPLAAT